MPINAVDVGLPQRAPSKPLQHVTTPASLGQAAAPQDSFALKAGRTVAGLVAGPALFAGAACLAAASIQPACPPGVVSGMPVWEVASAQATTGRSLLYSWGVPLSGLGNSYQCFAPDVSHALQAAGTGLMVAGAALTAVAIACHVGLRAGRHAAPPGAANV